MTATRTTLLALAERVEAATAPDRGIEREIAIAVGWHFYDRKVDHTRPAIEQWWRPGATTPSTDFPRFMASLDAAMSLVPSDAYWRLGHDGDGADPAEYKADVIVPKLGGVDARGRAIAVTPPLALTAASLRAIAGSLTDD